MCPFFSFQYSQGTHRSVDLERALAEIQLAGGRPLVSKDRKVKIMAYIAVVVLAILLLVIVIIVLALFFHDRYNLGI